MILKKIAPAIALGLLSGVGGIGSGMCPAASLAGVADASGAAAPGPLDVQPRVQVHVVETSSFMIVRSHASESPDGRAAKREPGARSRSQGRAITNMAEYNWTCQASVGDHDGSAATPDLSNGF